MKKNQTCVDGRLKAMARRVLDPRSLLLKKDGRVFDSFRVGGRVSELALTASLEIGFHGVRLCDLPPTITMHLDPPHNRSQIQVHHKDREMGLAVATHLRARLHASGWCLLKALVKAEDVNGVFLGEHDAVVDQIVGGAAGVRGLVSMELKCRRLYSHSGCVTARLGLRREEVGVWKQLRRDSRIARLYIRIFPLERYL